MASIIANLTVQYLFMRDKITKLDEKVLQLESIISTDKCALE